MSHSQLPSGWRRAISTVAFPGRTVEVMAMSPLRTAGRISPVNRGRLASRSAYTSRMADRPGGPAARRKGEYRARFVQVHDAVHVTGVGPLQEEPVQIFGLQRALRGFNAIHVRSFGRDTASPSLLPRVPTSPLAWMPREGPADVTAVIRPRWDQPTAGATR